jgi:hypothetical protein
VTTNARLRVLRALRGKKEAPRPLRFKKMPGFVSFAPLWFKLPGFAFFVPFVAKKNLRTLGALCGSKKSPCQTLVSLLSSSRYLRCFCGGARMR